MTETCALFLFRAAYAPGPVTSAREELACVRDKKVGTVIMKEHAVGDKPCNVSPGGCSMDETNKKSLA